MKKMFLVALAVLMFVGVKPAVAVDGNIEECAQQSWFNRTTLTLTVAVCYVAAGILGFYMGYRRGFNELEREYKMGYLQGVRGESVSTTLSDVYKGVLHISI